VAVMKVRTGSAINGKACISISNRLEVIYENEYNASRLLQKV
jgi:hypothetical protein